MNEPPNPLTSTERPNPRYSCIDVWEQTDILDAIIEGQFAAVAAVYSARSAIASAAVAMEARLRDRGRLVYVGAGTSGRLAVQDGAELIPTFSWSEDRLLLLMAGGPDALVKSIEGAEDQVDHAAQLMSQHAVGGDDVIVAVAASGTTPFTLACLREGKRRGALTVGIANNSGTPILNEADCSIWLNTGSEPIAGSTRLKAGTAQKITLNALSSLLMILLGKVYQGLMVDVRIVNEKLAKRGEHMLVQLSGRSHDDARQALTRAEGDVKAAALLLRGCDLETARRVLDRAGGRLREALESLDSRV